METTITLRCYGIVVTLSANVTGTGGNITSDLHEDCDTECLYGGTSGRLGCSICDYNKAIDGIESLILAHAVAGVDIASAAYIEGIETAVQTAGNQFS